MGLWSAVARQGLVNVPTPPNGASIGPQSPADAHAADAFDLHAAEYGVAWERDPSARAMRQVVQRLLAESLSPRSRVLDVGCGPGTDAAWLIDNGHQVEVVERSVGMLRLARQAAPGAAYHHLSAEDVGRLEDREPFDAALMDFGVANAVDLRRVAEGLSRVVRQGGLWVVVTMPRFNPSWMAGALRRRRFSAAARRLAQTVDVAVEGVAVETRYRGVRDVRAAAAPWFRVRQVRGMGLVLPPPGSRRSASRVARLAPVDAALGTLPGLRHVGDHVVIVLERATTDWRPGRVATARRRARVRRGAAQGDVTLQMLILEVTNGCQSRCIGCGHRGPAGGEPLTVEAAGRLAREARQLGARSALITGGEPLLRPDLGRLLDQVRAAGLSITLLTNGLALRRHAGMVARRCDQVVVSLDGFDRPSYTATRGIDGLPALATGLAAVRAEAPHMPLSARVTVTASNARHLRDIVRCARSLGLDGVSFLAADTDSSGALGRDGPVDLPPVGHRALAEELGALRAGPLRRWVLDSDVALDRLLHRARAAAGVDAPRPPVCDAPFTSALVTADLALRPCFFLPADADASDGLAVGLQTARESRASLDVATNPACARCVCWARLA